MSLKPVLLVLQEACHHIAAFEQKQGRSTLVDFKMNCGRTYGVFKRFYIVLLQQQHEQ